MGRRHGIAGHPCEMSAEHGAQRHAAVGTGGLQQVPPGDGVADRPQQLEEEREHEQTPINVIEVPDSLAHGIHRPVTHAHSMAHAG